LNIFFSKCSFLSNSENQLSHCELLAELHMIKLYFIHQIENENGIETIPHLEAKCVENAFKEMREEGYEDDGLFDDMKLFFQPLTITDKELNISPDEMLNANKDQNKQIEKLNKSIDKLNKEYNKNHDEYKELDEEMTKLKDARNKEHEDHQLIMQTNLSYRERTRLNFEWCGRADAKRIQIKKLESKMAPIKNKLQEIKQAQTEKEESRNTIQIQLSNTKTKIDRNLIQLHRGFIMYGPPGIFMFFFVNQTISISLISVKFRHRKISFNE